MEETKEEVNQSQSEVFAAFIKRNEKRLGRFYVIGLATLVVLVSVISTVFPVPHWLVVGVLFFLLYTVMASWMLFTGMIETKAEMKTLFYRYIGLSVFFMFTMLAGFTIYYLI